MSYVYTINSMGLNNIVFFSSAHSAYNYAVEHNIRMSNGKIKVMRCTINNAIAVRCIMNNTIAVRDDVRLLSKARRKAISEAKCNTSTEMTENV